jgi:hypothetical protein
LSFSFGVDSGRLAPAPYTDFRHIRLCGTLLRPRHIDARSVELTLLPDAGLNRGNWPETAVAAVGSLTLNLHA